MITLLLIFMALNLYPRIRALANTRHCIDTLQTLLDAPTLTLKIFPHTPLKLVSVT